jgi:hypothetical protein
VDWMWVLKALRLETQESGFKTAAGS